MSDVRAERREPLAALLLCAAGAGLVTIAATRGWVEHPITRPAPLPALQEVRTGTGLLPWLSPLALVALAGTGAVLATRGAVRRLVGGILLAAGLALAGGGAWGVALPDRGAASPAWPILCALGGLLVAVSGGLAAGRGHRWPGLGTRYERPTPSVEDLAGTQPATADGGGRSGFRGEPATVGIGDRSGVPAKQAPESAGAAMLPDAGEADRIDARGATAAWDALDRGEDPTDRSAQSTTGA